MSEWLTDMVDEHCVQTASVSESKTGCFFSVLQLGVKPPKILKLSKSRTPSRKQASHKHVFNHDPSSYEHKGPVKGFPPERLITSLLHEF